MPLHRRRRHLRHGLALLICLSHTGCSSIRELCRVAAEVRIFPLLTLAGSRSPFVDACLAEARACGREATTEPVDYEFQRGGREMFRITRAAGR